MLRFPRLLPISLELPACLVSGCYELAVGCAFGDLPCPAAEKNLKISYTTLPSQTFTGTGKFSFPGPRDQTSLVQIFF